MGFVFPGKIKQDKSGPTLEVHPLHQHSLDSTMSMKALLANPVSRTAFAKVGGLDDLAPSRSSASARCSSGTMS